MTDFDESLFEKIRGIICECLSVSEDAVTLDTDLFEDLKADSLDLVDLISAIESEYSIEASDEVVETISTVRDVIECVKYCLGVESEESSSGKRTAIDEYLDLQPSGIDIALRYTGKSTKNGRYIK